MIAARAASFSESIYNIKKKLTFILNVQLNTLMFVFIICQIEGYLKILKLNHRTFAFTSYKAFLKYKERSKTSLFASFSAWLLKKIIYLVTFY